MATYKTKFTREEGITGKVRARRQWFTGLPIMEVEVVRAIIIVHGTVTNCTGHELYWRTATLTEAAQIQYGAGLVDTPKDPLKTFTGVNEMEEVNDMWPAPPNKPDPPPLVDEFGDPVKPPPKKR